jgi:hypothetical protein
LRNNLAKQPANNIKGGFQGGETTCNLKCKTQIS